MLLRIGFILASYVGMKIYDNYKNKQNAAEKELKAALKSGKSLSELSNIEEPDYLCDRYYKAGIISMGLSVLTRTFPLLYIPSLGMILYTSIPIIRRGERQLVERRSVGHDLLYSVYIILAFLTRQEKVYRFRCILLPFRCKNAGHEPGQVPSTCQQPHPAIT